MEDGASITSMMGKGGEATQLGGTTMERVQDISGVVMNPGGADAPYFEGSVYLVHNGNRQQVSPTACYYEECEPGEWEFHTSLVLDSGANTLKVVVEDEDGFAAYSSPTYNVNAEIPPRDITVTLTWETDMNDVDLHIWGPGDSHAWYSSLEGIPGGHLDLDDTDGYGPETFTMENAAPGEYVVKVRYYDAHGVTSNVPVTVRVSLNEGAPQAYTHVFTAEQANQDDTSNDWLVTTFTMD
jgi:uncharacterized protein YfaP (DUF2135 family)